MTFRTVTSFIFLFVDDHLSHGNICFPGSGISIKVFQVPFVNLFDIRRLYILSCLNFSIATAVHHIFPPSERIAFSHKHFFSPLFLIKSLTSALNNSNPFLGTSESRSYKIVEPAFRLKEKCKKLAVINTQ